MSRIHRSIGIQYGDMAAEMADIVSYQLRAQYGQDMSITDIGSGDVTDVAQGNVTYETNYEYIYNNEEFVGVKLTCEDHPFLKNGVAIGVTSQMISLYKEIMLSTYLLEQCDKTRMLSNEAMAHSDNWSDVI